MADTADRRAERETSDSELSRQNRADYHRFKALGICISCRKSEVKNRAYCYACSDRQVTATYKTGLRSCMRAVGLDPTDVNAITTTLKSIKAKSAEQKDLLVKLGLLISEGKLGA